MAGILADLAAYEGGQMNIHNPVEGYRYCGEIAKIGTARGELFVRFAWMAQCAEDSNPQRWVTEPNLKYRALLHGSVPEYVEGPDGSQRIRFYLVIAGEEITLSPADGEKMLDRSLVEAGQAGQVEPELSETPELLEDLTPYARGQAEIHTGVKPEPLLGEIETIGVVGDQLAIRFAWLAQFTRGDSTRTTPWVYSPELNQEVDLFGSAAQTNTHPDGTVRIVVQAPLSKRVVVLFPSDAERKLDRSRVADA